MGLEQYNGMGYASPSFLDTEEEHDRWHHGLYKGLKIMDPRKLCANLRIKDKGWRNWYHNDDHYHDFAMLGAYGFKGGAVALGVYGMTSAGLI